MTDVVTMEFPPNNPTEQGLADELDQLQRLAASIETQYRHEPRDRPYYRYTELERALMLVASTAQDCLQIIKALDFPKSDQRPT